MHISRPTNERERLIRSQEMVEVPSGREVLVKSAFDKHSSKKFTFDRAFGPESKQSDVYQHVASPLIDEVLAGYNCTVFAYGQTGTGKTHTMIGDEIPTSGSSWDDVRCERAISICLWLKCFFLLLTGFEFGHNTTGRKSSVPRASFDGRRIFHARLLFGIVQ